MRNYIHPHFRLNGHKFNFIEELRSYGGELLLSDEEHLIDLGTLIVSWFDEKEYVELTTSGTTGPPKVIQIRKESMINSAKATGTFFGIGEGSKALLCMSTKYVGGKLMLIRSLILGWELDFVKPTSSPLLGNVKTYDFVAMVPMQVEHSLKELSKVKTIIIGGAKVSQTLKDKLKGVETKVYETYGMTETVTHIAAKLIEEDCFTALPHAQITVDERKCLVIKAPAVSENLVVTNDIVEIIGDRQFVWCGRFDNVINSGGVKLFPEQIEEKLSKRIPYRFFVAAKEDDYLGNKLVLVIESEPYTLPEDVFCDLHRFEKPKEVQFVNAFVETGSGKVKRKENIK
ncbi:AMP-binding protein [Myroides sp. LoEW2-1]|uniref:AMP-binding protein n=1 Tax=Myroides sp. LoEW2-1 TaxID=2683192 RepID=UPI0013289485|nr:AMP-binding protein [Myroides sp. LoEW2-1]MVX36724.1 AMP-binding protein [Myroides sp. LoEW2-1]